MKRGLGGGGGRLGRRLISSRTTRYRMDEQDVPGVTVHEVGERTKVQPVLFRRQALSEPVRDVVRAQQGGDHDEKLGGDEGEGADVPRLEDFLLEAPVPALAAWEVGSGVARRGDGGLNVGRVVAAAVELDKEGQR